MPAKFIGSVYYGNTAGTFYGSVIVLFQIIHSEVMGAAGPGISSHYNKFFTGIFRCLVIKRILSTGIAQGSVNVIKVYEVPCFKEVLKPHILFTDGILYVIGVIPVILTGKIGHYIRASRRHSGSVVKMYIIFHAVVKYSCPVDTAHTAAYVYHTSFHFTVFLSCMSLYPSTTQQS